MPEIDDAADVVEQIDRRNPRLKYLIIGSFAALLSGNAGLEGLDLLSDGAAEDALNATAQLATVMTTHIEDQKDVNNEVVGTLNDMMDQMNYLDRKGDVYRVVGTLERKIEDQTSWVADIKLRRSNREQLNELTPELAMEYEQLIDIGEEQIKTWTHEVERKLSQL